MKPSRWPSSCVLLLAASLFAPPASAAAGPAPKPWTLRDKYTVTVENTTLNYDVQTAEWQLVVDGVGLVIDDVGFRITLGDGSALDASHLGPGVTDRGRFTSDVGDGNRFGVQFAPKDGLAVRHSLSVYSGRPFVHLEITLTNTGDSPIEIARIDPGVVGPRGIHGLSGEATMALRHIAIRGAYPVLDRTGPALGAIFNDPAHALSFSVGVLPLGQAAPDVAFRASGGAWQGGITGVFRPAVRIPPGGELRMDPVWVLIGVAQPSQVDLFYSWATSVAGRSGPGPDLPGCWVTAPEGADANDLYRAIAQWRGARATHALVPWTWEGRPGSLKGAAPRWPAGMDKAADQIRTMGLKAGLTVDPLLIAGGGEAFAASSPDGRTWLNPSVPKGKAYGRDRLAKVAGWGYDFYVIHPSDVPDAVLRRFNLTRPQADRLAFALMAEAAGNRPVLPSAAMTLQGGLDEWLEAAAATSRMAEHGVKTGPVRFDATGVPSIGEDVRAAMAFFKGPIELTGKPNGAVVKALAGFLSQPRRPGRPLDAAHAAPKVWQIPVSNGAEEYRGDAVVMFPGAPAWDLANLDLEEGRDIRVWKPSDGSFLPPSQQSLPAAAALTVYGIAPASDRPVLLGATHGLALLLDDLNHLAWEENPAKKTGLLHGTFKGGNRKAALAYVAIPPEWSLRSGKAGGTSIRKKNATGRLQFVVPPGTATAFEFEFTRD